MQRGVDPLNVGGVDRRPLWLESLLFALLDDCSTI